MKIALLYCDTFLTNTSEDFLEIDFISSEQETYFNDCTAELSLLGKRVSALLQVYYSGNLNVFADTWDADTKFIWKIT